jgi:hypothetical protein
VTIAAIETRYAGHRFRSRLEARWAVFFDALEIPWEYEPQGFVIPRANGGTTPYLPDFRLTECGTWIEVKGSSEQLDGDLMEDAAEHLPPAPDGPPYAPTLLLLGPIPEPPSKAHDLGWLGLSGSGYAEAGEEGPICCDAYWGFGGYADLRAPECLDISGATAYQGGGSWLEPCISYQSMNRYAGVPYAYTAARSARFEHGESGA